MDTYRISLVPTLLDGIGGTHRLIRTISYEIFDELRVAPERRGDVEYGYLVNKWRREGDLIAILNDDGDLTNGATTSDEGTEVGPYVVFRLENGNDVSLLILDKAFEQ